MPITKLKQKIEEDLKQALLSRDSQKVDTLRMVKSSMLNEEISQGKRDEGLSDDEAVVCLQREVKKRKEAAEMYKKNNEDKRALQEEQELEIIQNYLPKQMSEEELVGIIDDIVTNNGGEVTQKNMGVIIQKVRTMTGPSAQGVDIARIVKQKVSK